MIPHFTNTFLKSDGLFHLRMWIMYSCRRHYKPLNI